MNLILFRPESLWRLLGDVLFLSQRPIFHRVRHWPPHMNWIAPLAIILALAVAVLYLFSPEQYAFYPQCMFLNLTGLSCPGCGSLRSMHHLLHGEFTTAFRFNPLLWVLVPGVILFRRHLHKPAWLWSLAGVTLIFTVARNL